MRCGQQPLMFTLIRVTRRRVCIATQCLNRSNIKRLRFRHNFRIPPIAYQLELRFTRATLNSSTKLLFGYSMGLHGFILGFADGIHRRCNWHRRYFHRSYCKSCIGYVISRDVLGNILLDVDYSHAWWVNTKISQGLPRR